MLDDHDTIIFLEIETRFGKKNLALIKQQRERPEKFRTERGFEP